MLKKNITVAIGAFILAQLFVTLAIAGPMTKGRPNMAVLRARNGLPIIDQLDPNDTIVAANGSVYMAGPPYSPKQTCGRCHDYDAITRAFHFREGTGPRGEEISDTWSDEHRNDTLYKYLANAYAYVISPGQYGAW